MLFQFPGCRSFLKRKVKEFLSHYYLKGTPDDTQQQQQEEEEEEKEAIVNTDSLLFTPLNIHLGKQIM